MQILRKGKGLARFGKLCRLQEIEWPLELSTQDA